MLWTTTLHTHVAPAALSRAVAYDYIGGMALAPVGAALAGPLVASVGAASTLELAALLILVLAVVVLAVPEVRQLRSAAA